MTQGEQERIDYFLRLILMDVWKIISVMNFEVKGKIYDKKEGRNSALHD